MTIISQWLTGISFSRWWRELKLHVIDLKEHPYCCTLPPRKLFNTESGSVNEACKKKRAVYCTGLDCSLIYT